MHMSHALIASENPNRLINRLCKHWGHKFPVHLGENEGRIELPLGECQLRADGTTLAVELQSAEAEAQGRMRQVVAEHLERMATGETLAIEWQDGPAGRATA
ncbi:DUF2218 domain-containing protein [Stutzerimonas urumqiensis]|uniref:DUF2218 domain-containing protein n=1 Tax=Stutzerimonas urumqiensis TaxID=638269 RepID=UPI003BACEF33